MVRTAAETMQKHHRVVRLTDDVMERVFMSVCAIILNHQWAVKGENVYIREQLNIDRIRKNPRLGGGFLTMKC